MSPQPTVTEVRLNNITTCLTRAVNTYEIVAGSFKTPFSDAICNTTQSLLKFRYRRNFATKTLHKIHTFLEAQQKGSKVKKFFRQGEMSTLLKECKAELQQMLDFFQIKTVNLMKDVTKMQEDADKRHQEVLDVIETLADTSSDGASFVLKFHSSSRINQ
ncbi:hypothetical protein B0H13DRAFT_1856247 [Mycena leptocephala]|nr:hypothetical protein B0H13DRAFT_1856247 [Mycena leptocephala]